MTYCKNMYDMTEQVVKFTDTVSVNPFRDKLKTHLDQIITNYEPMKVARRVDEADS